MNNQYVNAKLFCNFFVISSSKSHLGFQLKNAMIRPTNNTLFEKHTVDHTVDLVIFARLHFREFLFLGLFTKLRIREFSFFFTSAIIITFAIFLNS